MSPNLRSAPIREAVARLRMLGLLELARVDGIYGPLFGEADLGSPVAYTTSPKASESRTSTGELPHSWPFTLHVRGSWNSEANHLASARSKYVPISWLISCI
jgi:hypothetical protein